MKQTWRGGLWRVCHQRAVGTIAGFRVTAAGSDLCVEKLPQLLEERVDWMKARRDVSLS